MVVTSKMTQLLHTLSMDTALGPGGGVIVKSAPVALDMDACIDRVLNAQQHTVSTDDEELHAQYDHAARQISAVLGACGLPPLDAACVRQRAATRAAGHRQVQALLRSGRGVPQRTPQWYAARQDMITASDIAQALGCGKFGTQRDFMIKKCEAAGQPPVDAEAAAQQNNASWAAKSCAVPALKWGVMYEPAAAGLYAAQNGGVQVHEFGLLRHVDTPFLGASPDGITDTGVMVEIKCPWRRKIDGEIPVQYYLQIQGQLAVCGLQECDYFECEFYETKPPPLQPLQPVCPGELDGLDDDGAWDAAPPTGRGLILELPCTDGSAAYEYPQGGAMPVQGWPLASELQAWARERIAVWEQRPDRLRSSVLGPRLHWWVLRRAASQRVRFDPQVWEAAVRQLGDVWSRVLRYRADPAAFDADVVVAAAPRARRRKIEPAQGLAAEDACAVGYAFVDDDDDEDSIRT